jgi:hypothetical protein
MRLPCGALAASWDRCVDGQPNSEGKIADVFAFDDLIYSEPQMIPEPKLLHLSLLSFGALLWRVRSNNRVEQSTRNCGQSLAKLDPEERPCPH